MGIDQYLISAINKVFASGETETAIGFVFPGRALRKAA
jgi:hypothetical protein